MKNEEKYIIIDIETNALLKVKNIWMCGVKSSDMAEPKIYLEKDIKELIEFLSTKEEYTLVGHNLIEFDLVHLEKHWGIQVDNKKYDTVLKSRALCTGLHFGHTLEMWGYKLNMHKGEFNDWDKTSKEMEAYCKNDVSLTEELYFFLTELEEELAQENAQK